MRESKNMRAHESMTSNTKNNNVNTNKMNVKCIGSMEGSRENSLKNGGVIEWQQGENTCDPYKEIFAH